LLWAVAVHSKEEDPDIKLMGLHVQVRRSRHDNYWAGNAWPEEQTRVYRTNPSTLIIHPAGKITMSLGASISRHDIIRVFAHELRHIGQFHRGRKEHGYLTCSPMFEEDIEPDCYEFEDLILDKMAVTRCKGYKGEHSTHDELLASAR
jgi:hypothetical protein